MQESVRVDLTNVSFDEFITFLFDREVSSDAEKRDPWYWHVETTFDPAVICAYYMRLFQEPEFLSTRFSKAQLETGFWAIQGPNLNCSAYRIIQETDLPFSLREKCIRSMFNLFIRLFFTESLDTSVSMCGIQCATTGIAAIGNGSAVATMNGCRTLFLRRFQNSSRPLPKTAKGPLSTDWAICIIPILRSS